MAVNENKNSLEYWQNRADNYQSALRNGQTSRMTDDEIETLHNVYTGNSGDSKSAWDIKDKYKYLHRRNKYQGDYGFEFTPEDAEAEWQYRSAIRGANGDPAKIAQINRDNVRREWMDYHKQKRADIEKDGASWEDWLQAMYGTKIDPAAGFGLTQSVQPVAQDNTSLQPSRFTQGLRYMADAFDTYNKRD